MKRLYIVLTLLMVTGLMLGACATPTPETVIQTVEVPVVETVEVQVVETMEVVVTKEVVIEPTPVPGTLTRNETLYFNGQQWSPVVGWNPYSSSMNNALAVGAKDAARVIMFETLYLYNMMDGKSYPLLADGDPVWNDARTEVTLSEAKSLS